MLKLMPRGTQIPALSTTLQDIGNPTPTAVAKALGVHERTVQRWIAADSAPQAVLIALFWVSRWGMSLLDAELFNSAAVYRGLADTLRRENAQLRQLLGRLGHIGDFGSANDPAPEVVAGRPSPGPATQSSGPDNAITPRRTRRPNGLTAEESAWLQERLNARLAKRRMNRLRARSAAKAA